jgi:hypothetical protein
MTFALCVLTACGSDDDTPEPVDENSTGQASAEASTTTSGRPPDETSNDASSSTAASPTSLEGWFEDAGFVVQPGAVSTFTLEDCAALTDCFGNNATTPYLLFNLPPHPDRPGEVPESVVGDLPNVPQGMSSSWFLEPNEAVVLVGRTPPPAKYFGLSPYVFTRALDDATRYIPFASVADTLNMVTLRTDDPEPFDAEFSLVVAGDAAVRDAATTALSNAGFPEGGMNNLVFSPERVRFGLDADADQLMLLGRVALIQDPADAEAFLDAPPLQLWRMTFQADSDQPESAPRRAERGDGTDEANYAAGLDALEDAIEASLGDTPFEAISVASSQTVAIAINPEQCLASGGECLGDNSDTTYAVGPIDVANSDGVLTLGPDEAFIVYGVNHVQTGKATYANISVYAQTRRAGVLAVSDDQMFGSANRYVPDEPDRDALWAIEVRRSCDDRPFCVELPSRVPGVPLDENLFFIFRAYLQPGSTVSPGHGEILTERVIKVGAG